ncbi:serine/threonine-protein kinase [Sandaracinus amylolyticus]|uniref:Serine/threonine protein kinase n=1 Tax=Sandaracinus amylolyticus TaxID=927083 RepID=A0A0F6YJV1_9BACT|nr:serine/threonine-protein kinase [Sandaracinus amylolyticus]AKF08532.1 serine/threonine protein kinase [Sandaracinus amylolyticus]
MARACPHCGARHPGSLARCPATGLPIGGDPGLVGTTIAGRYHLVRLLGDGGMGAVYKAADQVLRRFVAIKLLHPNVARNPSSVERFQREARAAAAIGHPNIIDILDFGLEDKRPYMVMEYLRGRSLSQLIATEGAIDIKRACAIATHTLAGLAAAHDRGILHRDLKPANLMLVARFGDRNFVKVCDFGFAALFGGSGQSEESKTLTPERTLVGTPAYAAPERLRGDDRRDPRTDVYSVGVVLFEMLAGQRPFDAPTFAELARKVRNEPAPSIRTMRPDVSEGLERVIARALSKVREDRWASAEELAAALVPFGGRTINIEEDAPSDSFTFEMMRIKARETKKRGTRPSIELPRDDVQALLALRNKPAVEKTATPRPDRRRDSVEIPIDVEAPQPDPEEEHRSTQRREAASRPPGVNADATIRTTPVAAPLAPPQLHQSSTPGLAARDGGSIHKSTMPPPGSGALRPLTEPAPPPEFSPYAFALPPAPPLPEESNESAIPLSRVKRVPDAETDAPPSTPGPKVQGRLVVSVLRFVARKFGERALKDLLDAMPAHVRGPFDEGIQPDTWVDYDTLRALVEEIDARLGQDDLHMVLECGRAAAEGAFEVMRKVRPPQPPPELLIAEMPQVMQGLTQGLELQVRRLGKGYGRLELLEQSESSLTTSVLVLGFLERSLERFGAEDVEVNLLGARALEDPQTLIDISWLG